MKIRLPRGRGIRQWLGLSLALLLTLAPPLNLAGAEFVLQAQRESVAQAGHGSHGHSGQDQSGSAHHKSLSACLQCLALGGMSLAGDARAPDPAPQLHAIGPGWTFAALAWDSRGAKTIVCRGPPALA